MKTLCQTVLLLLLHCCCGANEIDKLQTPEDVRHFLAQKISKEWEFLKIFTDSPADGKKQFMKIDLDNNGLTDLLIMGEYMLAVTDNGNHTYSLHYIDHRHSGQHSLADIIYKDETPLIIMKVHNEYHWEMMGKTDTLVYKFGGFMEYNPQPENLQVAQITFSTSGCFGSCPVYELKINQDRTATYNAIEYNAQKGKFKGTIKHESYNRLMATLNYISMDALKKNYRVIWTDDETGTLEIKLATGQTLKISDYGMIGTYGLANLYERLGALRKSEKWEK